MSTSNSKSERLLDAARFFNTHDESKGCPCKNCKKSFKTISSLLRHLSHAQDCQYNYGSDFVEGLRIECRKKTKENWRRANEENIKAKSEKAKIYYIPNKVKYSETGRPFGRIFKQVFEPYMDKAKQNIKEHTKNLSLFLSDYQICDLLDKTFEEETSGNKVEHELLKEGTDEFESEEQCLEAIFSKLESLFQFRLEFYASVNTYPWEKARKEELGSKILPYALNKAFLDLYDEDTFKAMNEKAKDFALDEVFFKFITSDKVFDKYLTEDTSFHSIKDFERLENKLACAFESIRQENLFMRCQESGLVSQMKALSDEAMNKKLYQYYGVECAKE